MSWRDRCGPNNRALPPAPCARTSLQIRSTTWLGVSGSPNTSIVRRRPASLTTLPRGLSRSRRSASAGVIAAERRFAGCSIGGHAAIEAAQTFKRLNAARGAALVRY